MVVCFIMVFNSKGITTCFGQQRPYSGYYNFVQRVSYICLYCEVMLRSHHRYALESEDGRYWPKHVVITLLLNTIIKHTNIVLYLFLLYKLLFISYSTCFGSPCVHLQELTTQWYLFTCGALTVQAVRSGWLVVCQLGRTQHVVLRTTRWTHNQPTRSDRLHSHYTTPHVKKYH